MLLVALAATGCEFDGGTSADAKPASTASTGGTAAKPGSALAALNALPVKGRAPKTGYVRTGKFGPAWSDSTTAPGSRNGCDTRNDILRRDLVNVTGKDGSACVVAAGTLPADPYTGKRIDFVRGRTTSMAVQIDHVVALSDAWQKGAQQISQPQREALANDPLNLIAADGPANQQKSDADAASWLPANKSYRCTYVARQIAVKTKYELWVTAAEREAMQRVLNICPAQALPGEQSAGVAVKP
ncbi:HNH endonuclease family protein [Streptomyces sp. N35]|uniref:HNH endonuclease family protein n=1 Tax=Streptomyces sp. N35 TaxID=2795730 RepID=UPI0018F55B75|nr:HNH endonuclease family protein [Streptomyces sp. N35]